MLAVDPSITCDTLAPAGAPEGLSDLVDELRAAGLDVEPQGDISQPFDSVGARILKVNEDTIQVFEYADETTAGIEAGRVSLDGHTFSDEQGRTFMDLAWIDTPHFLRNGTVIVLYVGNDLAVLDALGRVLGPQFAGEGGESVETPMSVGEPKTVEVLAPIDGYEVSVEGRMIIVTVTNTQPAGNVMCTMQYGTVEARIDLGGDFEPGGGI